MEKINFAELKKRLPKKFNITYSRNSGRIHTELNRTIKRLETILADSYHYFDIVISTFDNDIQYHEQQSEFYGQPNEGWIVI